MTFILGSASPRRRELLERLNIVPDAIRAADIDETPAPGELPRPYCGRMAREKAQALEIAPGEVLLTADTTVALGRRILGKPGDAGEAADFLTRLGGRRHQVITAIAVRTTGGLWEKDVVSAVRMKRLSDLELNAYLASGEWRGKAGGYGIQGMAGAFIPWISGSYPAIMGLPLVETAGLLQAAGYPLYREAAA
ncbi:MAG: septum formation protein Maf [Rhodobacteraceae bacterium]|nr:MAG: septum formation protein Maf [Paracoccaceae bacterium]